MFGLVRFVLKSFAKAAPRTFLTVTVLGAIGAFGYMRAKEHENAGAIGS